MGQTHADSIRSPKDFGDDDRDNPRTYAGKFLR